MPPREFSGGGSSSGGGGSSSGGSGAPAPSPPKPDKGKGKRDSLEEDLEIKERVDLWVRMLQDQDPDIQEHALDNLRDEVRSMSDISTPKSLIMLSAHCESLKICLETIRGSLLQRKMSALISVLECIKQKMVATEIQAEEQGVCESKDRDAESKEDQTVLMKDPFANLPRDLIVTIVAALPCCRAERQPVSHLNSHWRRVIQLELPVPSALPWLFMPSSTSPVFHTSTSSGRWHNLKASEDFKKNAQIRGSAENGWVVLAMVGPHRSQLFNLNSGDLHPLPSAMLIGGKVLNVTVMAAVLSGLPGSSYTVAALVKPTNVDAESPVSLVLGSHSSYYWEHVESFHEDIIIQDLIYFKNDLFLLTSEEDLVQLVIRDDHEPQLRYICLSERSDQWLDVRLYDNLQRYLCESEGKLFMIVKCLNHNVLLEVKVFELDIDPSLLLATDKKASWVDVSELRHPEGRVFFVGKASSRSFGTTEDGGIHFLDDRHFAVTHEQFLRDDMGTVSFKDMVILTFPAVGDEPLPPPTSDQEPPSWWLP